MFKNYDERNQGERYFTKLKRRMKDYESITRLDPFYFLMIISLLIIFLFFILTT